MRQKTKMCVDVDHRNKRSNKKKQLNKKCVGPFNLIEMRNFF